MWITNELRTNHVDEKRLILKDELRSTYENLTNSFNLIDAEKEKAKISVVSNHFYILTIQIQVKKLEKEAGGIGNRVFLAVMKEPIFYI